jgi:hypothetical protein
MGDIIIRAGRYKCKVSIIFTRYSPKSESGKKLSKNSAKIPKYEISRNTFIGSGAAPCGQTD